MFSLCVCDFFRLSPVVRLKTTTRSYSLSRFIVYMSPSWHNNTAVKNNLKTSKNPEKRLEHYYS